MARFHPRTRLTPYRLCPEARVHCFLRFGANRFEELNNNS
jgi:hypothetical protein